jgi:predicted restriction endonuclease
MKDKASTKKKMPIWRKISISIGALVIFFITFFLIIDTSAISGYKIFMWERMNTLLNDSNRMDDPGMRVDGDVKFEELEMKVSFKLPKPNWLPKNYELENIDYSYSGDLHTFTYKYVYKDNDSKYISIFVMTKARPNLENTIAVDYEIVEVGELKVIIMGSSDAEWQAIYINEQGFEIAITTLEDKETLLKIIENMS